MKLIPKLSEKRKLTLLVSIILLALAIVIALYTQVLRGRAKATWWDDTWAYRKALDITNSNTGDLTDFQVSFTLDTATLIADGKMQSDCDDIRITDSSGTLLSHWLERNNSGCSSSNTKIYVKVPTVTQGVDATTLYLYYGNNTVSNIEDGESVFLFFDDFEDSSIDTSKWTKRVEYGTITEEGGFLKCADGTTSSPSYGHTALDSSGYTTFREGVIEGSMYVSTSSIAEVGFKGGADNTGYKYRYDGRDGSCSLLKPPYSGWAIIGSTQGSTDYEDTWLPFSIKVQDDGSTCYADFKISNTDFQRTDTSYATQSGRISLQNHLGSYTWYDDIRVRKYVATDPTATFGNEETTPDPSNPANTPDTHDTPPVAFWRFDEETPSAPYTVPTTGLITYWTLDEESGTGAYLLDQSGNENHATPTGTSYVGGITNGARSFPGGSTSHRVTKSSFADFPTTSISTSLWIKTKDTNSDGILAYASSATDNDWLFYTSSNLVVYCGGGANSTGVSLNDGKWHHLVVTWQSSDGQLKVYKDGSLAHSSTLSTGGAITQGGTLMLGQEQDSVGGGLSASQSFAGNIDEVLIYNRVLNVDEVQDLFENSKTFIYDSSNNNHGQVFGTTIVEGLSNNARSFSGSLDYIEIPDSPSLVFGDGATDSPLTIVTKVYPNSINTSAGTGNWIISKRKASTYDEFQLTFWEGILSFTLFSGDGNNIGKKLINQLEPGKWYSIAVTYDGSKSPDGINIYIDSVLQETQTSTLGTYTGIPNSTYPVTIGKPGWTDNPAYCFDGIIDTTKIYNYVRTPEQIRSDLIEGSSLSGSKAVLGNDGGIDNDIVAEHPFADNMVLYWKFEEGSGTTVTDLSGSGHNGTITEALWVEDGYYGKALSFDGSNDRVYHGSHMGLGISNVTLEAWVNIDSLNENGAIIDIGDGGDGYGVGIGGSSWDYSGNNLILLFDQVRWINTGYTLGTGWKHIVMTLNSESKPSVYVNGELVYSDTGSNPKMPANQTWIGGYYVSYRHLDAIIDEVKIYNTALNNIQVREAYKHSPIPYGSYWGQSGSSRYCVPGDSSTCNTPIGEWLFEENGGTTAYDSSGYDNTGTMVNMDNSNWILGREGAALSFNGTDNYLDVGTLGSLGSSLSSSAVTLSFWFKSTYTDSISQFGTINDNISTMYVVNFNRDQNDSYSAGRLTLNIRGDGGANLRGAANVPELYDGEWHFLSLVGDASSNSIMIYLDGSKQSVTYGAQNTISTTSNFQYPFIFGATNSRGTIQDNLECELDQIQIYNYARTPSQIAWDYNKGKPTGHWKLDECSGSTANDSSGNNYQGSISIGGTGTQTAPGSCTSDVTSEAWSNGSTGKINSSLSFDGTDDYISLGNSTFQYSNNFTVSAWVHPNEVNAGGIQHILGAYGRRWGLGEENGNFYFMVYDGSNRTVVYPATTNKWTHLTAVKRDSGTGMELYVNGISVDTDTTTSNISYASGETRIGNDHYRYPNRGFNGLIDDVRIYNYPLTEEQIKILHNYDSALRL